MKRWVATGSDGGTTCCHTARMPGVVSMTTKALAAASIPGGSSSSTG
jgi:hypothetical protein